MEILSQVDDFEKRTVTKRTARVDASGWVVVVELDNTGADIRRYRVPIATVANADIQRCYRKQRFQEYVPLPPMGTI